LFHKPEEELRECDKQLSKDAEEQRRKSRLLAGLSYSPTEAGEEDDEG
jgi:hypothetical protein